MHLCVCEGAAAACTQQQGRLCALKELGRRQLVLLSTNPRCFLCPRLHAGAGLVVKTTLQHNAASFPLTSMLALMWLSNRLRRTSHSSHCGQGETVRGKVNVAFMAGCSLNTS